jgi:hypothetical protein
MHLVLPFSACRGAGVESTHEPLLAWAKEYGLTEIPAVRQVFETTRIGEFSALAYPFADHATRVLIDSWVLWTLIVDQLFEEKLVQGTLAPAPSESRSPGLVLQAVDPADPLDRYMVALAGLSERTRSDMSALWQREFSAHVALFIRSCHTEAAHRLPGSAETVDLESFVRLRRGSFATDLFLDLVEKAHRVDEPSGPVLGPVAAELRACAADLGGWCNDLLSYRRERGSEDRNNLVLLLARDRECSVEEAVVEARAHVHDRAWQFLSCETELVQRLHYEERSDDTSVAAARQWALGVELLVSGSLTYQQISRRWQEQ